MDKHYARINATMLTTLGDPDSTYTRRSATALASRANVDKSNVFICVAAHPEWFYRALGSEFIGLHDISKPDAYVLGRLLTLLGDERWEFRTLEKLNSSFGWSNAVGALDIHDIDYEIKTRRSDGAKLIRLV